MNGYYYIITAILQMKKGKVSGVFLALGHLSTKHGARVCPSLVSLMLHSGFHPLRVTEGVLSPASGAGNLWPILP